MEMNHCNNCGKYTGHQRKFGVGTVIAIIITWGFWLLAMPLYPKRCIICGSDSTSENGGGHVDKDGNIYFS